MPQLPISGSVEAEHRRKIAMEVNRHDDRLTEIESDVATLEADVDAVEVDVADHETRLATAEGEIDVLQARMTVKQLASQVDSTTTTKLGLSTIDITMVAGSTYLFEVFLHFNADVTGGMSYDLAATGGLVLSSLIFELTTVDNATDTFVRAVRRTALSTAVAETTATSGLTVLNGRAVCTTSGAARPRFSQASASGTSSVLLGSWCRYYKL